VKDTTTRTFDGMTGMLTNFVTTGKASFGDFAKSVLTDLSSMMIKMAMFKALKVGMSVFSPTGNDPGQLPMRGWARGNHAAKTWGKRFARRAGYLYATAGRGCAERLHHH